MQDIRELKQIGFSIASTEDIIDKSVYEVTLTKFSDSKQNTVYDHRGGSIFNKRCETCRQYEQQCSGHFGFIRLKTPIVHPLFFTYVLSLLKIFCHVCSKLLLTQEHLSFSGINKFDGERKISEIVKKVKKVSKCFHCHNPKRNYFAKKDPAYNIIVYDNNIELTDVEIKSIFADVDSDTVNYLGISNPKNCILEVFPVIPPCCRPYEFASVVMKEDDLTKQLVEIVKANNQIAESPNPTSAMIQNLKLKIETFCRNPKKKSTVVSEPIKGIRERLTGKDGQLRTNLMGKRTEMAARTVIGPGPNLKLDEVGIPESIAKSVTFPMEVFEHNINQIKQMVLDGLVEKVKRDGQIIRIDLQIYAENLNFLQTGDIIIRNKRKILVVDFKQRLYNGDKILRNGVDITPERMPQIKEPEIFIGDIAQRRILDNDCVLLNRQPTLWKGSMMAFKCVISKTVKTFTFNLAVCKAFNSDFDGDEQNAHFPQSISSVIELQNLSTPQECILSSSNGTPIIVILQDALLGSYLMTLNDEYLVNRNQYSDIVSSLSRDVYDYLQRRDEILNFMPNKPNFIYSGKGLISLILPNDFNYKDETIEIVNGILVRGFLTKTYLGSSKKSLIYRLKIEYGNNETVNFINDIQFLTNKWLTFHSFSINVDDFKPVKIDVTDKLMEANYISKTILNKNLAEAKINIILSNAKDIGIKLSSEIDNNMVKTIKSGSKGDFFNLGQVKGMLGQQLINGRRIQKCLDNNTRTLIHYPRDSKDLSVEDEYQSRGFISKGFYEGIDPKEFLFHAISGRQGVCDTAMTTHSAGYSMRKLIKLKEDIKIDTDGIVSDSGNNIYSYAFGDTGFNPSLKHNFFDKILSS